MTQQRNQSTKRVFLTGATGSTGIAATRELVTAGHQVVGVTRSSTGAHRLLELGATPIEVELFDRAAVTAAMESCDVVAHFATSIPTDSDATKAAAWQLNDRLRIEGTANLIAAAEAVGVQRFIFESISLAYPDHGADWIDEATELEAVAPMMRSAIEAEAMVASFGERGGEAVSLRFGRLYGPGRASDAMIQAISDRQMPVVGRGRNYVSSIHSDDVGMAVAASVAVAPGTYNIVDDEPMTQREWMDTVVGALEAPPARQVPYALARLVAGKAAKVLAVSQRVSNRRFRGATGWSPRYASAAVGWAALGSGVAERVAAAS